MIIMKFGGTSVGGYEEISRVISIIQGRLDKKPIVLTSAMSKVTDLLYKIADKAAAKQTDELEALIDTLRSRHICIAEQLLENNVDYMLEATSSVNEICDELEEFAKAICILGELSPRSKAIIISNGELLSSTIISYAMKARGIKTAWVDARKMIITDENSLKGEPNIPEIEKRVPEVISAAMQGNDAVITQGFIASSVSGEPTVLGRGGSDYSASLVGMALNAEAVEIWTDVDGILTADPRKVPNAKPLERISFEEAAEMAHFGAKVLHPSTIEPAMKRNIPIYVLNSKNPSGVGTSILGGGSICDGAKSVSSKEDILVINIFSTRMINASGFLGKVFSIFSSNKVSVDLISTSEANISVTIEGNQDITNVVKELSNFATVEVDKGKAQVSVVGQNLINSPAILEKIFTPLKDVRTYMVSQGASLINLSIVVDKEIKDEVVCAIHESIFA